MLGDCAEDKKPDQWTDYRTIQANQHLSIYKQMIATVVETEVMQQDIHKAPL